MNITIFGQGNMGNAIAGLFTAGGHSVQFLTHENDATLGDIVVLAIPYSAIDDVISRYGAALEGKVVVDITNSLNFETFDSLVVPTDSSAAAQVQEKLPQSFVVKGFNTNFAATLMSGKVAGEAQTTVLLASDSQDAKAKIAEGLSASNVAVVDSGNLNRARELEAIGFLQLTLAASDKINWTSGFALYK